MALLTVPVIASFAVLLYAIYKFLVYPVFISPLSSIPSAHWSCHFTSLWMNWLRLTGPENKTIYKLHEEKGPILRIAPNELSVNCVEGLKTIYGGGFEKNDFYARRFTNYGTPPMFAIYLSKPHSVRKRMVANSFSKSNILSSAAIQETTKTILFERFLPLLEQSWSTILHAEESTQTHVGRIDALSINYAFSMDTFTAFQFGASVGTNFLENGHERNWYLKRFFSGRPYFYITEEFPRLASILIQLGIIPDVHSHKADLEKWQIRFCDEANKVLSASENKGVAPTDNAVIFSQLRESMQKVDNKYATSGLPEYAQLTRPQPYPRRLEMASEMFDMSAAAIETSGITLTYAYYELSRHPSLIKQLRDELSTLSPPILYPIQSSTSACKHEQELPSPKALDFLPLLNAILIETLRLYPAVAGPAPRITPSGQPTTLAGYPNVPANTLVQASAYTLHRNANVFPEPNEWKPERWLESCSSKEQLAEMYRWFWAFGSGGRMCVGSHFAINSMKFALAAVYTNFTTVLGNDVGEMEQKDGFVVGPVADRLLVQFHRVRS